MAGPGKRGAKGKYEEWLTPDGLTQIRGWARDKYTDKQIAGNIGIAENTFCDWKNRFPAILEALKKGRAPVIEEVEDALYKGATGYDVEEKIEEITVAPDGTQQKHIRKTTRHIPPNAALTIFALKNLKKWKFKDKPVEEISADDDPLKRLIERLDREANNRNNVAE